MTVDASLISYMVRYDDVIGVQRHGITRDYFVDEWRTIFNYLLRARRDHETVPSVDTVTARFPDIELPRVRKSELPMLISQIRQRRKYIDFLEALNTAAGSAGSQDDVDEAIQALQGRLNSISFSQSKTSHLVDLFSADTTKKIKAELKRRNSGENGAIPSGLTKYDTIAGGLQRQRMITVIGRSGIGKSWVDLWMVAHAVNAGAKVMLYPLEMTLFETATRLYTIFTQMHYGPTKVLKNYDLTTGKISTAKVARFLGALEDKFAGQLYVADVSSLADPYTNERIEAEVEAYHPDMFWVDYITLLKGPPGTGRETEGHELVKRLSNGIKNTAMRRNVVGGVSAQVNRESLKVNTFLPRIEHIAYGDSIGQDSDQVFSLNKAKGDLYWALVKNRHGPEIGKTRVRFDVNNGILHEYQDEEEEDD